LAGLPQLEKWSKELPKSAKERKAMQRRLNAAGVVHASGWIEKTDAPEFCKMLQRAEPIVRAAENDRNAD
jgi:ClpP class serine protease